jgi:hypothetical protein
VRSRRCQLPVARTLVFGFGEIVDLAPPQPLPQQAHLGAHGLAQLLLLGDQPEIGGEVLGPQDVGALEHHVFEEVGEAGDAGPFVDRAQVSHPAGGDGGGVVALHQESPHAVGQGVLPDLWGLGAARVLGPKSSSRSSQRGASFMEGAPSGLLDA